MNSPSQFNNLFKAMKINGTEITPPTSKYREIFTSATPPSSSPSPITIEIQPLNNTSVTLSYCKSSTHNSSNVGYTTATIDSNYSSVNTNIKNLQYSNNLVTFQSSNDENVWVNTNTDVSTNIVLSSFDVYPTINIFISNRLKQQTYLTNFSLWIYNAGDQGAERNFGNYFQVKDYTNTKKDLPIAYNTYIKIADNTDSLSCSIYPNLPAQSISNPDYVSLTLILVDQEVKGFFKFILAPPGTTDSQISNYLNDTVLFPVDYITQYFTDIDLISFQGTTMYLTLQGNGLMPGFKSDGTSFGETIHEYGSSETYTFATSDSLQNEKRFEFSYK